MPPKQHTCSLCHRPRSKRFHRIHPLKPGDQPLPGVCRRCIPTEVGTMIIQIHHHYATSTPETQNISQRHHETVAELAAEPSAPPYAELPAESANGCMGYLREEPVPPRVRHDTKPKNWLSRLV